LILEATCGAAAIAGIATVSLIHLAMIYRPLVVEATTLAFCARSRHGGVTHTIIPYFVVINLVADSRRSVR